MGIDCELDLEEQEQEEDKKCKAYFDQTYHPKLFCLQQLHNPFQTEMIPLRQHNDIVEKLMKELTAKDQEIKALQKDKNKNAPQAPQLQPTKNQELLNKKIAQLNKQHKERINTLTQQIRAKSIENKDLKERLTTKHNLEVKEKEHIAEVMKKTYDRKPASGTDYKISALISHYEGEVDKKNKFIQSLQKKIRELQSSVPNLARESAQIRSNENYKIENQGEQQKGISLSEHQREINKVRSDMQRFKKLFEQKEKEYKDLARRYSQLTNEYYKIINSYGLQEQQLKSKTIQVIKSQRNVNTTNKTSKLTQKSNALENLLHEMAFSQSQPQEASLNKQKFSSKVANIESQGPTSRRQMISEDNPPRLQTSSQSCESHQRQQLQERADTMKLYQIMQELQVSDQGDIIPKLIKIKASLQEYNLVDTVARSLQVFFCNIGKGKLTKQQLVEALEELQSNYLKHLEAIDTLDEVCIQAGAKREKLKEKIQSLLATTAQYYAKLKSIKFLQQVTKGNKVIEFIEFFDLDKEELALPQQLAKIQEQLKSIDKFIKQSRAILEIGGDNSSQEVLELVLRYLEKTSALVSQLEKKKRRKSRDREERD